MRIRVILVGVRCGISVLRFVGLPLSPAAGLLERGNLAIADPLASLQRDLEAHAFHFCVRWNTAKGFRHALLTLVSVP